MSFQILPKYESEKQNFQASFSRHQEKFFEVSLQFIDRKGIMGKRKLTAELNKKDWINDIHSCSGDPLKFHKHGSKKRDVPNGVAHNDVPSKPVKWKLPEPQLHMVQLPPANSNAGAVMTTSTEPRVTTRTVVS